MTLDWTAFTPASALGEFKGLVLVLALLAGMKLADGRQQESRH